MKKGINGLLETFQESISGLKAGDKIVFTGTVGVCTPFIELLAYSVRDKEFEMVYVPNADLMKVKRMKMTKDVGYTVVDEKGNPEDANVVVILGGLALPKYGCAPEDVIRMIETINAAEIIGVGFMNIFERSGWDKKIKFDVVIDASIEVITKS
jgi:hypothetical protein